MALEALKNANRVIGIKQAAKAVKRGSARQVFVADDADRMVLTDLIHSCEEQSVSIEHVETMEMLGKACGIEVGAAAVAVLAH